MIKLYCRLLLLLIAIPLTASAQQVKMGYFINDPHITQNPQTKKPEGVLVLFLQEVIAPEMDVTFAFVKHPLTRVLASMDQGIIDGAALFGNTLDREARYHYPNNSFTSMQSAIAIRESNSMESVSSIYDISGMKVLYSLGAIKPSFMRDDRFNVELISGENTLARNLMRLHLGRADAVYWPDKMALIYAVNKLKLHRELKVLSVPEHQLELFTIFSKKSRHKHLKERYDKAFEKVGGRQRYQQMMQAYIGDNTK